jgi:molybdopterin converting factor small subunit
MLALAERSDIAVPVHEGRHHPLAAVYRTTVLPEVRALLDAQRRRPFFLFERVRTREVGAGEWADVDPDSDSLRNVNTPEEFAALVGVPRIEPHRPSERPSERPPDGSGSRVESIIFELYGTVRTRARRDEVEVRGASLGEAIAALEAACPPLAGLLVSGGRLAPHYRLSINGREFVSDTARPLVPGDRLILLPAAVGG